MLSYFLKWMPYHSSDGSGTRKPENPTQPEGFLLARTQPEPEKVQTRPENPKKPEILEK